MKPYKVIYHLAEEIENRLLIPKEFTLAAIVAGIIYIEYKYDCKLNKS